MKIAWVEDDKTVMPALVRDVVELLDKMNGSKKLIDEFREYKKLSQNVISPENLKDFFVTYSLHRFEWFDSYASMNAAIDKQCAYKWDVVIIDLNLEQRFDKTKTKVVPTTAGFALYIQLLRSGFPAERIVFFTANSNQFQALNEVATAYDIPPPRSFDKLNEVNNLTTWLRGHLDNKELTLRRGIVDGCEFVALLLQKEKDNGLRINNFAFEGDGTIDAEAVLDWLEIWPRLLPDLEARDKEKKRYSPFMLALLSLWDKKANPSKERGFNVTPFILTHARNWIAHGKALHDITFVGTAFLFLLATRGLVKLPAKIQHYEKVILSIFPKGIDPDAQMEQWLRNISSQQQKLTISEIEQTKIELSKLIKQEEIDRIKSGEYTIFNKMANAYVNSLSTKQAGIPAEVLLMQSLVIDLVFNFNGKWTGQGQWKSSTDTEDWLMLTNYSLLAHLGLSRNDVLPVQ